jgi:hypothetical protein
MLFLLIRETYAAIQFTALQHGLFRSPAASDLDSQSQGRRPGHRSAEAYTATRQQSGIALRFGQAEKRMRSADITVSSLWDAREVT